MNAHIPQSVSATAEAETLMRSAVHIVSGQRSSPVNGMVQDGLVGPYLLTNIWEGSEPDTMVSVKIFENCIEGAEISDVRYEDLLSRAKEYYPSYIKKDEKSGSYSIKTKEIPGKLMFSILFPPNLFYKKENVKIKSGIILPSSGPITKKIIGAEANSVIHVLWGEYSPETCLYFLSETQQLIDRWLPTYGFSMGISDCMSTSTEDVARILTELNAKIGGILSKTDGGIPNKREETEIAFALNQAMTDGANTSLIKKNLAKGDRNALKIMQYSGAKGKNVNLMQIAAFVGQQSLTGGFDRVPATLSGGTRTLPIFEANDYSPEARGFVERGYLKGLNPQEVFFHAAGGRVGIIATAIKTASTGYIQKRIGRKIEDFRVEIDGSVRDANKRIIQFLYGDDGMDPKKLCYPKGVDFPFFINLANLAQRLNSDAKRQGGIDEGEEPRSLEEDEVDLLMSFISAGPPKLKTGNIEHATNNTREILRKLLKDKNVVLYESVIPTFFADVKNTYEQSKSQYGDMVGLDAASFIGEPTTQLSTVYGTRVVLREEMGKNTVNEIKYGKIGEIVDEYLEKHGDEIVYLENDSVVWHPSQDIFIMTVNTENEKTEWKKISEFSRHPTNGDLVKVRTKSKREITTTLAHSHLARTKMGKIVPKKAGELKKGDFIPVSKKMNSEILYKSILIPKKGGGKDKFPLDFDNGWLVGAYLAEGNITNKTQLKITNLSEYFEKRVKFFSDRYKGKMKTIERLGKIMPNNPEYEKYPEYPGKEYIITFIPHIVKFILKYCGTGSGSKQVPGFALFAPLEFVSGILRGYFDGDGSVNAERQLIRVHSISQNLLEQISLLLSRFGIFGTFGVEKKSRENPLHNYIILRKYARLFMENVGSDFPEKLSAIKEIVDYNERDDVHSRREDIDRIPEMGEEIARVALPLKLPGYSRNYGRWTRGKSAIGRETLTKYRETFNEKAEEKGWDVDLSLIDQAINSDIIWDEITDVEIIPDPKEMVYDFGVEGNHTFMIQNGIFTHNTLNVFHLAGLGGKEENLGVPRFEEILNATKSDKQKFPACSVYFDNEFLNENTETVKRLQKKMKEVSDKPDELEVLEKLEEQVKNDSMNYLDPIKKQFEETTVGTFFLDYEMQYLPQDVDPDVGGSPVGIITYQQYEKKWWVTLKEGLSGPPLFEPEHWVLIMKFDTEEMFKRDIDLDTICETIQEYSEGKYACVTSPNILGTIEVYCNFSVIKEYATSKIDLPPISEDEDIQEELLTPDNILFFTVRESVLKYIKDVKISGIEGVTKIYTEVDKTTREFYFDANCRGIAARPSKKRFINILTAEHVDPYKTLTNDMHAIYEVLGIEATRKFLITEITKIITDRGASFINPRHIQLLVDSMVHTGEITSVRRDGISRDVGPIAKIMFEQAVDNASQASVFGEPDMMRSVSSSIMYGMTAKAGTGVVNIKRSDKMPVQPVRPIVEESDSDSEEETETASDIEDSEDEKVEDEKVEDSEEKVEDSEEKVEDSEEEVEDSEEENDEDD